MAGKKPESARQEAVRLISEMSDKQCQLNRKCFYSTLSTIWNKAELESVKWEAVSIWGISR